MCLSVRPSAPVHYVENTGMQSNRYANFQLWRSKVRVNVRVRVLNSTAWRMTAKYVSTEPAVGVHNGGVIIIMGQAPAGA